MQSPALRKSWAKTLPISSSWFHGMTSLETVKLCWFSLKRFHPEVTWDEVCSWFSAEHIAPLNNLLIDLAFPGTLDRIKKAIEDKVKGGRPGRASRGRVLEQPPEGLYQMWDFARYWFRLTLDEFGDLTPKDFWDMWQQRQIEFKREQYLQGIVASIIAAAHGTDNITPFDFVGKTADEAQRDEIVLALKKSHQMTATYAPEKLPQERAAILSRLKAQNIPDAEGIVVEVFGE